MSRAEVRLGLNAGAFDKGLSKAKGSLAKFASSAGRGFSLGGLFGGALGVAGIDRAIDRVEVLDRAARRLNVPTQFVRELEALGDSEGLDLDNMIEFLQDVNEKALDAASGGGEAAAAFGLLGLRAEEIARMSLPQQFRAIADAVANATDKQGAIAAVMKIGSDEATKLLPLLRRGASGIDEMTGGMQKFGEESTRALRAVRAEMEKVNRGASDFLAQGIGGLRLGGEALLEAGLAAVAKVLGADVNVREVAAAPFQRALDQEREKEVQRQRQEAARRGGLDAQRASEEQSRMIKERLDALDHENALRKAWAEVEEKVQKERDEQVKKELERRRGMLEMEMEANQVRLQGLEKERAALEEGMARQGVTLDSLTGIGLGAGGVNYALARPRGEQQLQKVLGQIERVERAVEAVEIRLESDEFGGS